MEKIYKFAKKFRFAFNYCEDFITGTINCFMIAPKTDIVFDYTLIDEKECIYVNGERFDSDLERALSYYEDILILKGEFKGLH